MNQRLTHEQRQAQRQAQHLTQQQMLVVRLLGMSIAELEQSVRAEMNDNLALEGASQDAAPAQDGHDLDEPEGGADEDFAAASEREERQSALNDALESMGRDDEMPEVAHTTYGRTDGGDFAYGDQLSFYDTLKEQMVDVDLTPDECDVMEYVIGSLDSDGLLRKDTDALCDELGIYYSMALEPADVERIISVLQTFDPAGIAARSLQECLLLQVRRKPRARLTQLMERVLTDCYDDFMNKRWDRISAVLGLGMDETRDVCEEISRLNPKPGSSLGEAEGRNTQQITPDFIVETLDDGTITFTVNGGDIPELFVSPSFTDMLASYQRNRAGMSGKDRNEFRYASERVERAKGFIEAVRQRRRTLYVTMKAIIEIQRDFFLGGDEADLRPMGLKDVADRTGLDISTISRVSNMKYAQTRWGTFKLRHFFSEGVTTESGEEISTRRVKAALREFVDGEDKRHPLSDDRLEEMMRAAGYPVARRTITKYRAQMRIPVARLRKRQ